MSRPSVFSAEYWRGEGGAEGALLRVVFLTLVTASAIMLTVDFADMWQRASDASGESDRMGPVVFEPPTQTDQERPYYPKAMPLLPGAQPPLMPGIPARPTSAMLAGRMAFTLDEATGNVSAIGRIEPGTAVDFDKFLKETSGKAKRVWLYSSGGSVADAMSMGRAIRKSGVGTMVGESAYCASSCPLVFMGGVTREAGRKALIGVHQVYTLPAEVGTLHEGLANAQRISASCQEYLVEMGVDPRAWIKAMKTSKSSLYVFTPQELTEFKLVTAKAT